MATAVHTLPLPSEGIRFWRFWTLCCAGGEFLGLALAALVFVLADRHLSPLDDMGVKIAMMSAMVFAGVLEGGALGIFQWTALRGRFPLLPARRWITITAMVAGLGWLAGSFGPVWHASASPASGTGAEPSLPLTMLLAAIFGIFAGGLFGAFQWFVLRRHARSAGRWILANALGWGVALPWIFLAAALPSPKAPFAAIALLAGGSGVLAGLSVGAITGWFLLHMTPVREPNG